MKVLSWIVFLATALVVLVFAFANRTDVTLSLWPFDIQFVLPVYLMALVALLIGFGLGGLVTWVSMLRYQLEARRLRKVLAATQEISSRERI